MTALHAVDDRSTGLVGWTTVCREQDLMTDRGVCALVAGTPVAVFRCSFGDGHYAVDDLDPYSGASVMSRGLVGMTAAGVAFVASPLRKQRFDLRTGVSLDDPDVSIGSWPVQVVDGLVVVADQPVRPGASSRGNDRETPS